MPEQPNEVEIIKPEVYLPSRDWGMALTRMVADPNIPADKLAILVSERRENQQYEAREAYNFHFAQFAGEMPPVERDGMVDLGSKGKYPFTTYEQMDLILRPLLFKHGLALQFWASAAEQMDIVIVHGALVGWGWERESVYPVPPDTGPGRNALQARGSAQSYAKRYNADLLCNIVRKGQDDDGRTMMQDFISPVQLKTLQDLVDKTGTNAEKFMRTMLTGVEYMDQIRVRDFPRLELALRERLKKQVTTEKKDDRPKVEG